jgi:all-trans-retinol 13,14-reductase
LIELIAKKFPGIRQAIRTIEAATPLTWRDYTGTPGGSMYGIEKDFHDPVRSMILPRTKVRGLYFTGQNINIHGALGVTIGAYLTCGEILGTEYLVNKVRDGK